jgi:hypothetical protein
VTLGAAVTVDDVIVGMAGWDGNANNISGVADSLGNSYTLNADKVDDTTGNQSGRTWRSKVTVAGTPVITVTFTTSLGSRRVIAAAWSGANAAPFDASVGNWQTSPGTGTDAVTSTALTPGQNDSLLIGFHQNSGEVDPGTGTLTAGTNYTNRLTTNAILMVEDRALATAASVAATLTISNDHRSITHLVVIKPGDASPMVGRAWTHPHNVAIQQRIGRRAA